MPRSLSVTRLGALATAAALALSTSPSAARAAPFLYIRGAGDGHGVGMSQYGAYGYALHGYGYASILAHYYTGTALGATDSRRTVRVLLASGRASFSGADAAGPTPLDPAQSYQVSAGPRGTVTLRSAGGPMLGPFPVPLTVSGRGPLQVGRLGRYRGSLQFRPDGRGGVETVDAVGLEDYVRGVVGAEVPSGWPAAALEAQAVAARTYAITAQVGAGGFDLYGDDRSQAYAGVAAETRATDAAVAATTGQVVTYDGRPAVTYFFASSGGHTESVQDAWPGSAPEPWLRGVPDPYDDAADDPYYRWTVRMSLAAAQARLRGIVRGRLLGIRILRHGASPRIVTARVLGARGTAIVTGPQLEAAFNLDSTYASFTIATRRPG